jgi:predicted Zn-dependent protease
MRIHTLLPVVLATLLSVCDVNAQQPPVARSDAAAFAQISQVLARNLSASKAADALSEAFGGDPQALALIERFLQANPDSPSARMIYSRLLAKRGDREQAQTELLKVMDAYPIAAPPGEEGYLLRLGMVEMNFRNYAVAERILSYYVSTLEGWPDKEDELVALCFELIDRAEARDDYDSMLRWLGRMPTKDPELKLYAQTTRAFIVGVKGDLARARAMLAEIKPLNREDEVSVLMTEADILIKLDRDAEAYEYMRSVAARFPGDPTVRYGLAMAAEAVGDHVTVEKTLRAVIKTSPDYAHAYDLLGYSFAERGVRLREAHELISKARALMPEEALFEGSLGWVQYKLGNLAEAERHLDNSYAVRPYSDTGAQLGEVLWRVGKKDEALTILREVGARDPKNEALRKTLARLKIKL